MPTDAPGAAPPPEPSAPGGPTITATRGHVLVTGVGFLPNHSVTIRITNVGEDIVDYLAYTTDPDGRLSAPVPASTATERAQITATDHRPNPDGDDGLLWTNTITVTADN